MFLECLTTSAEFVLQYFIALANASSNPSHYIVEKNLQSCILALRLSNVLQSSWFCNTVTNVLISTPQPNELPSSLDVFPEIIKNLFLFSPLDRVNVLELSDEILLVILKNLDSSTLYSLSK